MSTMDVWSLTKADLETAYSQVLDLAITGLIDDGLLAEDSGIVWAASHAVIIRKTGQLSQWAKKLLGWPSDDRYRVTLVTLAGRSKGKHEEFQLALLEGGDETTKIQ